MAAATYQIDLVVQYLDPQAQRVCPFNLEIVASNYEWVDQSGIDQNSAPKFADEKGEDYYQLIDDPEAPKVKSVPAFCGNGEDAEDVWPLTLP